MNFLKKTHTFEVSNKQILFGACTMTLCCGVIIGVGYRLGESKSKKRIDELTVRYNSHEERLSKVEPKLK